MTDPAMFPKELTIASSAVSTNVLHVYEVSDAAIILLWFIFVTMLIGSAVFAILSWRVPPSHRIYHYLAATVTTISALSYFSMATFSTTLLKQAGKHLPPSSAQEVYLRIIGQNYSARLVDGVLSFPLILLMLDMIAGMDVASAFVTVIASGIMVLSGFFSVAGRGKVDTFGWLAFAVLAYVLIAHQILLHGRALARKRGQAISKFYTNIAAYTLAMMLGYIVFWGLSGADRTQIVSSMDSVIAAYAILDVGLKSVFGAWLVYAHAKLPALGQHLQAGWFGPESDENEGQIRIGEEEG